MNTVLLSPVLWYFSCMPVSACESCLNRVSATETGGKGGYVGVKFGKLMAPLGRLSPHGGNLGGDCHVSQGLAFVIL